MDVINIVDKLDELDIVRKNKVVNNWYSIYCPLHNDGKERRPSAGISIQSEYRNGRNYPKGFFHCFACGKAMSLPDLITEILKIKNIQKSGLDFLKENVPGFEISEEDFEYLIPQDTMESISSKYAIKFLQDIHTKPVSYVSEKELQNYRFTVPYMYERGLTDDLIEKYDIGVDMNFIPEGRKKPVPCITFPVRDRLGRCLFVARRSIEGKSFYLPKDIDKPLYGLYELPEGCKSVDIVEGVFDLFKCVKYGRPALAMFGTGSVNQIESLKRIGLHEIRVGTDPDEAGERGYKRLHKNLSNNCIIWRYVIPDGKDIGDLTEEEFKSLQLI